MQHEPNVNEKLCQYGTRDVTTRQVVKIPAHGHQEIFQLLHLVYHMKMYKSPNISDSSETVNRVNTCPFFNFSFSLSAVNSQALLNSTCVQYLFL